MSSTLLAGKCRAGVALLALFSMPAVQAETIVNIKGYGSDGAGTRASINYPLAPGYTFAANGLINPVTLTLAAGDYQLSDAWGKPGALYDTWNFQQNASGSWVTHFLVTEVVGNGYEVLFDLSYTDPACKNHYCAWSTEQQASDAFLQAAPIALHFSKSTTLAFVSADYNLSDNLGGISIAIDTPTATSVPEPGALSLMLAGLGLIGLGARHRKPSA